MVISRWGSTPLSSSALRLPQPRAAASDDTCCAGVREDTVSCGGTWVLGERS